MSCDGWRATGFKHRAPILFLNEADFTIPNLSQMNLTVIRDEKAFYYRENFAHNEHINLVGYSRVWGPLILSVMKEMNKFKLVLRSVSGTETREVYMPDNLDDDNDWTQTIFGSLAQDTFSQVRSNSYQNLWRVVSYPTIWYGMLVPIRSDSYPVDSELFTQYFAAVFAFFRMNRKSTFW